MPHPPFPTSSPPPYLHQIYNRDGHELGEFVRGDPYLRDMKNTKGHVSGCTGGQWHPSERQTVMTCGEDGTVRIWDAHTNEQTTVVKTQPVRPGRVHVTTACYSPSGGLVAAALLDGTLQLWDVRGDYGRSAAIAHVLPPRKQMVTQNKWRYLSNSKWVRVMCHDTEERLFEGLIVHVLLLLLEGVLLLFLVVFFCTMFLVLVRNVFGCVLLHNVGGCDDAVRRAVHTHSPHVGVPVFGSDA